MTTVSYQLPPLDHRQAVEVQTGLPSSPAPALPYVSIGAARVVAGTWRLNQSRPPFTDAFVGRSTNANADYATHWDASAKASWCVTKGRGPKFRVTQPMRNGRDQAGGRFCIPATLHRCFRWVKRQLDWDASAKASQHKAIGALHRSTRQGHLAKVEGHPPMRFGSQP
jgi:hypothetical protein